MVKNKDIRQAGSVVVIGSSRSTNFDVIDRLVRVDEGLYLTDVASKIQRDKISTKAAGIGMVIDLSGRCVVRSRFVCFCLLDATNISALARAYL